MSLEPTLSDVFAALQDQQVVLKDLQIHAQCTEHRFDLIDKRFDGVDQKFASVDKRFDGIDQRLDGIDGRLDGMDKRFDGIDGQLQEIFDVLEALPAHIDQQAKEIRADMATKGDLQRFVTKEYLDDKLGVLRDDLMRMARTSNKKFDALIGDLVFEKRMHPTVAQKILALEPFPQK